MRRPCRRPRRRCGGFHWRLLWRRRLGLLGLHWLRRGLGLGHGLGGRLGHRLGLGHRRRLRHRLGLGHRLGFGRVDLSGRFLRPFDRSRRFLGRFHRDGRLAGQLEGFRLLDLPLGGLSVAAGGRGLVPGN
ncbi:MAG: hypothetical protein E6I42_02215 [Chloroflexi bacterium]|nr:MAG: hypothetical protein E6I42_02215 [Chloroflexota bacterium]